MKLVSLPASRVTIGLLPPEVREQYGFSFHAWEEKLINGYCRFVQAVVPFLPSIVRYVPQYRRAQRRLRKVE